MSVKDMLSDLAFEANLVSADGSSNYVEVDADTLTDVVIDHQQAKTVSDVIAEQHHIEEAADELDAVAAGADEMIDRERSYSVEALQSLERRYQLVTANYGLTSIGTSFESEATPEASLRNISSEAKRAATSLRLGAEHLGDLSNEGGFLDIFRSKDTKLARARSVLADELAKLKTNSTSIEKDAVGIKHKGIGKFLTKRREPVSDLPKAISEDVNHIKGMSEYITERLSWLGSVKDTDTLVGGKDSSVNTVTDGNAKYLITSFKDNELPLMGNYGIYEFRRIQLPETNSYRLGGILTGGVLIVGALVATTGAGALTLAVGANAAMIGSLIAEHNATKNRNNIDQVTVAGIEKAVSQTLDLIKLQDKPSILKELETVKDHLVATVKSNNGSFYKECMKEVSKVLSTIELMKDHIYYITINLATLMERTNKAVK